MGRLLTRSGALMFRPMPVLTLLSVLSLAILVQLGNWQYSRYTEKLNAPAYDADDVTIEMLTLEVMVEHPGQVQQINGMADSEFIWRRYVPARVVETGEIVLALMDATGGMSQAQTAIADAPARLSYEGRLVNKRAERRWFGQADKPQTNTWYRLNAPRIGKHLNLPEITRVAEPLTVTVSNGENLAQQRVTQNPYAAERPIDPLPPERHFGYALTWWGMAIGLFGVYIGLHHARGRLRFRKT